MLYSIQQQLSHISSLNEEIASLSDSIVFLFFSLFIEEGLLISPYDSLEFCVQLGISFFLTCFLFLFFPLLCVKPPQTTILPSYIPFSLGWFWKLPPV